MKIIKPTFNFTQALSYGTMLKIIEEATRICYKSESKGDSEKFIRSKIIKTGHMSVLEHCIISVKVICDRAVSHEIVRHRIGASYSQESTRYVSYEGNIEFIEPAWFKNTSKSDKNKKIWKDAMYLAEKYYQDLLHNGLRPEQARAVLPNSLKTTINMTLNIRAWRHFFELRCSKRAHPDMVKIACMLRDTFKKQFPVFFEDM